MEEYKKIFGRYEVSSLGNVRNSQTGKVLKPIKDRYGYYVVCLPYEGKNHFKKIHRLVAEAFCENQDNKPCVDHIDGNRTNNVYTNLRWVTCKENTNNPVTLKKIKENCTPPKPVVRPVMCVERKWLYFSAKEAEALTGIDASSIIKCCRGKRKTAGGYHWIYAGQKDVN